MSQSEIERFIADIKGDASLLNEVKSGATGLSTVVETANAKGYDITLDEAQAYVAEQANKELTDDELDAVAGGGGKQHHRSDSSTQVAVGAVGSAVEYVQVATTAQAAAEVALAVATAAVAVVALT